MKLTRRGVLASVTLGITAMPGCVEYLQTGCGAGSKYTLLLTEVEREAVRTEPIAAGNLTASERRLVEKALDDGRYETCPQGVTDQESRAFYDFADRVQARSEDGDAYLAYRGRYYQIGLVLSAVIYAGTEHHRTEAAASNP